MSQTIVAPGGYDGYQAIVINRQVDMPLIADADTGFGAVTNTVRTVVEYERAGVAARSAGTG